MRAVVLLALPGALAVHAAGCSATPAAATQTPAADAGCPQRLPDAGAAGDASAAPEGGSAQDASGATDDGGGTSSTIPGDAGQGGGALTALSVSSGTLVPAFSPTVTDYTITSLNGLYPIQVTANASDPATPLLVQGSQAQSGVPVSITLTPCQDVTVRAGATQYTVHYVPSDLATYHVTTTPSAGTEDVLLTPNGSYLLVVDRAGLPLYYRTFNPAHVENFQRWTLPSGKTVYSTQYGPSSGSWTLGSIHLMDAQFGDLADLQLLPHGSHGALPAEGHDFLLIDTDHYVLMSYVQRTVDLSALNPSWSSQALVMNAVVQEISAGQVVFEWDSANVPSLYTDSTYDNTYPSSPVSDYLHMNSMTIDPVDGNFIFSFRYTSSIVKVDRMTGQILWTLGGKEDDFGLAPDQVFSWQHYVRRQADGSLWVFDNGNNLHPTRVVSFVLDEATKKVVSFTDVYDKPADQPQTAFMGAYTELDATRTLFGWGGWNASVVAPAVTEVAGGAVTWSLTFDVPTVFSYRALPVASLEGAAAP